MNSELEYLYQPNPFLATLITFCVVFIVLIATFIALDFGLATKNANTTAEVIEKTILPPNKPGQYPHLIILETGGQVYHVRVQKAYYNGLQIGTILLLVEERTRLTNVLVRYWLFDEPISLTQAANSLSVPRKPNRSGRNAGAVLNPQNHE